MEWILFAFLALIASAGNVILNRVSSNKVGSVTSAFIKSVFIVIACLIISACFGHFTQLYSLTKDQWIWVLVIGLVTSANWILYFLAIKRSHLEAFAPYEASATLFLSNLLFSIFSFASVTNGGKTLNIVLFFVGLACFLGGMAFAVFNKKINPKTKKMWVLYGFFSALALSFSFVIARTKLADLPSDIIAYHQMFVVFVVCGVMLIFTKGYKELKSVGWKGYGFFFLCAFCNALTIVFRYKALLYTNSIPSIVSCIVSLDFVIVSLATVLFFKADNKKQINLLLLMVVVGMALNVIAGLV